MSNSSAPRIFLVTNATQYAGPGIVDALLAGGCRLLCHDPAFASEEERRGYEATQPGATALAQQQPDALIAEANSAASEIDAFVFNDVYPITKRPIEDIPLDDLRATFEAVMATPFRLAQLALPALKARRRGAILFITSARERRPEAGYAVPTAIRAATTAFAKALALEAAPFEIQVNVVAPNYLASELYYPKARFVDDPAGRAAIAEIVPFGRLGQPEEIGELVAFLVSGKSPFTTGQTIGFTGGWA